MKTLLTLALATLTLAAATPAHAAVTQADLDRGIAAARDYWGDPPLCPGFTGNAGEFRWVKIDENPLHLAVAHLTQSYHLGVLTAITECHVELNSFARDAGARSLNDPDAFCAVIVHEYGHLLGHDHVADTGNVMNPQMTYTPPQCVTPQPPTAVPASQLENTRLVEQARVDALMYEARRPALERLRQQARKRRAALRQVARQRAAKARRARRHHRGA